MRPGFFFGKGLETFVPGPKAGALHDGGRKQVDVDIAYTTPHELLLFDEEQRFIFSDDAQSRQGLHQAEHFRPILQVAAGQLADHKVMGTDEAILQQAGQRWISAAQVIDPNRGIDQYHRLPSRRRGTAVN